MRIFVEINLLHENIMKQTMPRWPMARRYTRNSRAAIHFDEFTGAGRALRSSHL